MSLGARGLVLEGNELTAEALQSFADGIRSLTIHLQQLPEAYASLMRTLMGEYLRLCRTTSASPDEALLTPVAEVFHLLQTTSPIQVP